MKDQVDICIKLLSPGRFRFSNPENISTDSLDCSVFFQTFQTGVPAEVGQNPN